MCPACMTTAVLIAAGAASSGGAVALFVERLRTSRGSKESPQAESNKKAP